MPDPDPTPPPAPDPNRQPVVTDFLPENFRASDPSGWASALTGHVGTMLDSPLNAAWTATDPDTKAANLDIARGRVEMLRTLAEGYSHLIAAHEAKGPGA
jgi:hypothetical protein